MALTFYPATRVIESDASITDLPLFHAALRDWEDEVEGIIHPVTHTWKALDLGGGAFFYQADLINGWQLRFSGAGPFQVNGNLIGPIIPTGVHVERTTSAAFVTTAVGGSGPSASSIADAVAQRVIESGVTLEQMLRILLAGMAGEREGLGTGTVRYKSRDGSKDRIVLPHDQYGNGIPTVDGS